MLALADFAGHRAGDTLIGRASHELKCLADGLIGHDVEIGRLLELDGQCLLERAVEDGVDGGVDEVGDEYGIFLSQLLGASGAQVQTADDEGGDDNSGTDKRILL